jgi:hypothetical protein
VTCRFSQTNHFYVSSGVDRHHRSDFVSRLLVGRCWSSVARQTQQRDTHTLGAKIQPMDYGDIKKINSPSSILDGVVGSEGRLFLISRRPPLSHQIAPNCTNCTSCKMTPLLGTYYTYIRSIYELVPGGSVATKGYQGVPPKGGGSTDLTNTGFSLHLLPQPLLALNWRALR